VKVVEKSVGVVVGADPSGGHSIEKASARPLPSLELYSCPVLFSHSLSAVLLKKQPCRCVIAR
jgi:hypothetical protein